MEKKTELQALKHEEILLELESIRARRDRLLPICPNCSTQTMSMYHPMQQTSATSTQAHSQAMSPQPHSIYHNLSPSVLQHHHQTQHQYQIQSLLQPSNHYQQLNYQQQQQQQQQHLSQQNSPQLLSISIPQQQISPSNMLSPIPLQQLQAHLSQLQLIALPGKQSVTVECQTSPTANDSVLMKFELTTKSQLILNQQQQLQQQQQIIEQQQQKMMSMETRNYVVRINASTQTIDPPKIKTENKEINTDPIDLRPPPPPPAPVKLTRNQAVNCDLLVEHVAPKIPPTPPKSYEDKGTQSALEQPQPPAPPQPVPTQQQQVAKQKYFLYTCKYSYDPFRNSPNDNPEAELPLFAGDYLFILSEEDEDGFYTGELLNGKRGLVPSNFVERVNLDQSNINKYLNTLPKSRF